MRRSALRVRAVARRVARNLGWRRWPSSPQSWRALAGRLRSPAIEVGRLTVACVAAFLVGTLITPGSVDVTAALTALLVVQVTTVGTFRMSLVRIGAVLTGVLIAVGVASFFGLSWWSLAVVVAASLVLGKVLRLGEQIIEVPISAMLILAVSAPGTAAETRVLSTLLGAAVGLAVSLLVPAPIPNTRAYDAVRRIARSQGALLDEVALTLGRTTPEEEQVEAWAGWLEQIHRDVEEAEGAVRVAEETRVWNARALAVAKVHLGLRAELERLERCLAAERALLTALGKQSRLRTEGEGESRRGRELATVFAIVLDDLADALRAAAEVITARFGPGTGGQLEDAVSRSVHIRAEARAKLTDLVLLQIEQQHQPDLWLLQGSVFAAAEQLLNELDDEENVARSVPWLTRHGLPTSLTELHLPGIELPFRAPWLDHEPEPRPVEPGHDAPR